MKVELNHNARMAVAYIAVAQVVGAGLLYAPGVTMIVAAAAVALCVLLLDYAAEK